MGKTKNKGTGLTFNIPNVIWNTMEWVVWIFVAGLVFAVANPNVLNSIFAEECSLEEVLISSVVYERFAIFMALVTLLAPVLIWLICGKLPLEFFRSIKTKRDSIHAPTDYENFDFYSKSTSECMVFFLEESDKSLRRIHSAANTCLFIAGFVGFCGVLFIVFQFQGNTASDTSDVLLANLPYMSAFALIEFVALFFFRQYRILHNESKIYKEQIRNKQKDFLIAKHLESIGKESEIPAVISWGISGLQSDQEEETSMAEDSPSRKMWDRITSLKNNSQ